jgi:hypothetical protein
MRRPSAAAIASALLCAGLVLPVVPAGARPTQEPEVALAPDPANPPAAGETGAAVDPAMPGAPTTPQAQATVTLPAPVTLPALGAPAIFPPPLPLAIAMRGAFVGDLGQGASGVEVEMVQQRLLELHIDPGAPDGHLGQGTIYAIQALQKLHGLEPTGVVDAATWDALTRPLTITPRVPTGAPDRIEIDIDAQLLVVWKADQVQLVSHISSGSGNDYCEDGVCGTAVTPRGAFTIQRRIPGWRIARLGGLYNPLYFRGGFAVHGSQSVPTHPASHGCVRIPMHIADLLPTLVPNGEEIYVFDAEHPPEAIVDPARIQVTPIDLFA